MLFNSYIFIFAFLPITLLGYYLLSGWLGTRPAKLWLVAASIVYYGWWNPKYVVLILVSMLFNFNLGMLIGKNRSAPWLGKWLLVLGLAANLGLLGYYKYANFFMDNLNLWMSMDWHLEKILLPLGISFFTFQQVAYLIDARRGVVCEGDFADFCLFITFFPQLIAGPIVHHAEMMPQFARRETYHFRWDNIAVGITLFAIGLFKKVAIADSLSGPAAKVFAAAGHPGGLYGSDAWAGVLAYSFQIYFDFSGYSDMALGLGRMFGILLPMNFNSPYQATDIVDFWRRWHMTLSRCLRDYIYVPLGGNRFGKIRRYFNLMLTMLLGGLWHGAGWTFIIWGGLHGLYLALNHLFSPWLALAANRQSWHTWASRAVTFFLVLIGWVFFRAADMDDAMRMLSAMFGLGATPNLGAEMLIKSKLWLWFALLLAGVWGLPNAAQICREHQPALLTYQDQTHNPLPACKWTPTGKWVWFTVALLVVSILGLSRAGEFLYYNF